MDYQYMQPRIVAQEGGNDNEQHVAGQEAIRSSAPRLQHQRTSGLLQQIVSVDAIVANA